MDGREKGQVDENDRLEIQVDGRREGEIRGWVKEQRMEGRKKEGGGREVKERTDGLGSVAGEEREREREERECKQRLKQGREEAGKEGRPEEVRPVLCLVRVCHVFFILGPR